jgi:aryl-alcohol dehydrogenase-like predicted oxidoreductase
MYPVPPVKETQGRTDQYIGSWLKTGRIKREDVVIATKVSLNPNMCLCVCMCTPVVCVCVCACANA